MVHGGSPAMRMRSFADAAIPAAIASTATVAAASSLALNQSIALYQHSSFKLQAWRERRMRLRQALARDIRECRYSPSWASWVEALRQILLRQLDALYHSVAVFSNSRVHLWALDHEKFSLSLVKVNFRVSQRNFLRLASALQLPDFFFTENRSKITGTEDLLIYLRRMSERGRDQTLAHFVGQGRTEVSRIVKHCACWILRRWWGSSRFNPVRSSPERMSLFAELLRSKGCPYRYTVGFLDDTRVKVARPAHLGMRKAVGNSKYDYNFAYQLV